MPNLDFWRDHHLDSYLLPPLGVSIILSTGVRKYFNASLLESSLLAYCILF